MKARLRIVSPPSVSAALILCSLRPTAVSATDSPWQIRLAAVSMNTSSGTFTVSDDGEVLVSSFGNGYRF